MSLQFLQNALQNQNVKAMMDTIGHTEGAKYNSLFGDTPNGRHIFTDFSKHPNVRMPFGKDNFSTAAGRYQMLYDTWEAIREKYDLKDFGPESQDIACCELFSQRDCLQKIMDGDFHYAVKQCNTIWASLPGSPYGQPTKTIADAVAFFESAGGSVNDESIA